MYYVSKSGNHYRTRFEAFIGSFDALKDFTVPVEDETREYRGKQEELSDLTNRIRKTVEDIARMNVGLYVDDAEQHFSTEDK